MQQGGQIKNILPPNLLEALNGLVDRLNESTPTVCVLLIGTNAGVCLSRCYGSIASRDTSEQVGASSPSFTVGNPPSIREDILTIIETAWATLPSGCPPQSHLTTTSSSNTAHPLLKPLGFGDTVKSVTAFYDNLTMIHVHLPPLVITILATPHVHLHVIQTVVVPVLKLLLEPVSQTIVSLRKDPVSTYSNVQQQQPQQKSVQTTVHR